MTLNATKTIARCLTSVANQAGVDLEHIIIDGGSTDGTIDHLRNWSAHSLHWTSEGDRGISHAFNKGIALAQGSLIAILNADDCYTDGALIRAKNALQQNPTAGFAFGHCLHREPDGRTWLNYADPSYRINMRYFMPDVNHPTMIVRRSTYEKVGLYSEDWRYAMDYEWLCRANRLEVYGTCIDAIQTEMAMGGASDRNWKKAYLEANEISILYGTPFIPARIDFFSRLLKGGIRRNLVKFGWRDAERKIRLFRQRRRLSL